MRTWYTVAPAAHKRKPSYGAALPEHHIVVNRLGNVLVYRFYSSGHIRFWGYARSVQEAVAAYPNIPTRIVTQH